RQLDEEALRHRPRRGRPLGAPPADLHQARPLRPPPRTRRRGTGVAGVAPAAEPGRTLDRDEAPLVELVERVAEVGAGQPFGELADAAAVAGPQLLQLGGRNEGPAGTVLRNQEVPPADRQEPVRTDLEDRPLRYLR